MIGNNTSMYSHTSQYYTTFIQHHDDYICNVFLSLFNIQPKLLDFVQIAHAPAGLNYKTEATFRSVVFLSSKQTKLNIKVHNTRTNIKTQQQNSYLHIIKDTLQNLVNMCDYEDFQYTKCCHIITKRLSYCHFARNDPWHQCFGVKVTKHTWTQDMYCPGCTAAGRS